jgi:hypothetical protein
LISPRLSGPLTRPLAAALLVGALAAGYVGFYYYTHPAHWSDFDQIWLGARVLLAGENPYPAVERSFPWPLYYPLPALLMGLPLAPLSLTGARCAFAFLTASVATYSVARYRPGLWLLIASGPFLYAIERGQWSPLVLAACLIPAWGIVAAAKPTIGLAAFAYRPTRVAFIGIAALVLLSLLALPHWPLDWLEATRRSHHLRPPILLPAGFMFALAALRWRRPEARLFLVLACVPQTGVPYELVPLAIVPESLRERLVVAVNWMIVYWLFVAIGAGQLYGQADGKILAYLTLGRWPVMLVFGYLPILLMILFRSRDPHDR